MDGMATNKTRKDAKRNGGSIFHFPTTKYRKFAKRLKGIQSGRNTYTERRLNVVCQRLMKSKYRI